MSGTLERAIERRDRYAPGHAARVTALAEVTGRWLGWDGARLAALRLGGSLHDIGKVVISERVLGKPGPLTEAEHAQIRLHPSAGARLIEPVPAVRAALPCVLYHHERWDGRGYPTGRAATDIPIEARLLAIADAFDAMTSRRPYRPPIAPEQALLELERCAGTQFDPALVQAFAAAWQTSHAGAVAS